MPFRQSLLLVLLLLTAGACLGQAPDTGQLAPPLRAALPAALPDGLRLVALEPRCDDCAPWRELEFYDNRNSAPVRREKVSVQAGYHALYAYPGCDPFADVRVEQSAPGRFGADRHAVARALRHEFARRRERIRIGVAAGDPKLIARLERLKAGGVDYVEWTAGRSGGVDYLLSSVNDLGAATLGQLQIFVPRHEVIVTVTFPANKDRPFETLEQFVRLRDEFIASYAAQLK